MKKLEVSEQFVKEAYESAYKTMKAEDLMVENWVFDKVKQRNVIIWGISENHNFVWVNYANGLGVYTRDFDEIEPISLSEEILLKCGFEKREVNTNSFVLDDYITFELEDDDWSEVCFDVFVKGNYITVISYLHELQQLYKILTKQELEIKL